MSLGKRQTKERKPLPVLGHVSEWDEGGVKLKGQKLSGNSLPGEDPEFRRITNSGSLTFWEASGFSEASLSPWRT